MGSGLQNFTVHFWGVRGTVPTTGDATRRYGGNTSCIELRCGERVILLDAGTGLIPFGETWRGKQLDLLLSHTHIDHILGLPFFLPSCKKGQQVRLWAGHLPPEQKLREAIARLMHPPLFPLTLEDIKAKVEYADFRAGEDLPASRWHADGIAIRTLPLNHPDRATGYRIAYQGKSLCYITDIEHQPGKIAEDLVAFAQGADCLIYDSTYSDEEFLRYAGWGHSTWQQGVRIAKTAKVARFVMFHHDPAATDAVLDARAAQLETMHPGSCVAREGLTLDLLQQEKLSAASR